MVTLVGWNDGGGYDCDERRRRRFSVARVREPEKREEGTGESESGPGGVRGILRATGRQAERQEVAWACARALRPRACAYWREEEGDRGGKWRWAGLARWAWWAAEVSPGEISLLCFYLLFSILFCFVLV